MGNETGLARYGFEKSSLQSMACPDRTKVKVKSKSKEQEHEREQCRAKEEQER
jgi:hypothetical protein